MNDYVTLYLEGSDEPLEADLWCADQLGVCDGDTVSKETAIELGRLMNNRACDILERVSPDLRGKLIRM